MEEVFYEKLELKKDHASRLNNLEHMAQAMSEAGEEFGNTTPYGSALLKIAQAEQKLGQAERGFITVSASQTLLPIRRFLKRDLRTI
ncbi:hypothetical protein KIN20_011607 [Parelaphostrongylus tenuis]|uniref:BAR domain-containing protein n=1 Tax=Parelaphostrongylus tenuis TaxID=148309 RepID=A0AAD5MEB2_PARTN|nr:hypothetical protein KIN20_011607 [Parelaphostrongylus tenuis]